MPWIIPTLCCLSVRWNLCGFKLPIFERINWHLTNWTRAENQIRTKNPKPKIRTWVRMRTQNRTDSPSADPWNTQVQDKQPTYHIKLWTEASNHLANLHVQTNKQPPAPANGSEWIGIWWLGLASMVLSGVARAWVYNPIRSARKSSRSSSSINRVSQNKIKIKAKFNLSKIDYRPIMCSLRVPYPTVSIWQRGVLSTQPPNDPTIHLCTAIRQDFYMASCVFRVCGV